MSALWTAVAGAVIGGVGSAVAGNQASKATEGATNASIAEQNKTLAAQTAAEAPYAAIGTGSQGNPGAISLYNNLLGLGPQGGAGAQQALANTPGYQFALGQGTQNTVNQASAMGLGLSGNTLQGLDTFSTGLANQTYQSAVGNAAQAVGIGQAAASGQAANLGAAGSNISNALIGQGQTQAGIDANEIAGITKSIGNAGNQYVGYNTLQGLINPQIPSGSVGLDPGTVGQIGSSMVNPGALPSLTDYTANTPATSYPYP